MIIIGIIQSILNMFYLILMIFLFFFQHSIAQLEDIAWQTVQAGKLGFTNNQTQTALTDPDAIRHEIKTHLKFTLEQLAQHGFLLS